jgi:GTPase SAR1 family protein
VKVDKKELQTDKSLVQLMIWDLEGIDLYCGFKPKYLRGASAYIVVADQTNSQSLVEGMDIQRMVKEVSDIPGILAINKSDLSANWQWSKSDIQEIKQGYNCSFDTSAKTGLAVESMFTYIATILTE